MKHNLFLTLFLICIFGIGVATVYSQSSLLRIKKIDGSEKNISLSTLGKITFSATNLMLNYQGGSNEVVDISSVHKLVFGTSTGVRNSKAEKSILIYPNPAMDYITLKNVPEGDVHIAIYSVSGAQALQLQLSSASQSIDVSCLPQGLYILKVNNQAFKFTKL